MPHICKVALAASAETYRWDKGLHTATNTSVHNCGMYRKAAKKSVLCAARVRQECIRSCSLTSREKKGGGKEVPFLQSSYLYGHFSISGYYRNLLNYML